MSKNLMGLIGLIMVITGGIAVGMLASLWMDLSGCECECKYEAEPCTCILTGLPKEWTMNQDTAYNYFIDHKQDDPDEQARKDMEKEVE